MRGARPPQEPCAGLEPLILPGLHIAALVNPTGGQTIPAGPPQCFPASAPSPRGLGLGKWAAGRCNPSLRFLPLSATSFACEPFHS